MKNQKEDSCKRDELSSKSVRQDIENVLAALQSLQAKLDKAGVHLATDRWGDKDLALIIKQLSEPLLHVREVHKEYILSLETLDEWLKNPLAVLARMHSVSEKDYQRWQETEGENGHGFVRAGCNHPGCQTTKAIYFDSPKSMLKAEVQAISEIWYCRRHEGIAWEKDHAIADDLMAVLRNVEKNPGLSKTDLRARPEDLAFLEKIGLLFITTPPATSTGNACTAIYLTEEGAAYLGRREIPS